MIRTLLRMSALTFFIGMFALLSSGCAVTGGGYGYDDGVGVGVGLDYYEPYGNDYGGWGRGYHVGPSRRGDDHRPPERGGGHSAPHAYRSAPASHSMPSIPSGSRGGARH